MRRKIVKQGNAALTLTLPSSWTKKLNLKAGDELEVEEEKNFLKITTERPGEKTIEIDITELNEPLIWTYIISAYRQGYDEIKIKIKKEQIKLIQRVVDALLGLAIVEQTTDYCTIKDLSAYPSTKEFGNIKRRIFYLLEEMADSSLKAVKEKNKSALEGIEFQDYNINKFSNFCLRLINKKNLSATLEYIISELENLGDEYTRLSLDLADSKSLTISRDILTIFQEINELFFKFHKLYYNFNNKDTIAIVDIKNKINKKIQATKPKSKKETILLFHLSKIVHLITNIGERVIMMKLS